VSDPTPRSRSIFQYAIVLVIIAVVAAFLLDALYYAQEQAERTVMEATVRNMDSGLKIEVATRVMRGQEASIRQLVGANPVQWLEKPPDGYAGICRQELTPGGWCFDAATHEIVYRPRVDRHLEYLESGRPGLRWRVGSTAEIAARQSGHNATGGAIRLNSTTSFAWH